jgi:maltose/maltodextrin transport system substrate-binding protein
VIWSRRPPTTFDEVISSTSSSGKQGKKALLWDYNKSFFTWPMLAGAGGFVFGRTPQGDWTRPLVGVNTPGAVAGRQMLSRLIEEGVMPGRTLRRDGEPALRAARWR